MSSKNRHTPNTPAPAISVEMPSTVIFVDLDLIDANPWQPRQGEDTDHIQKLADSIAVDGLLQIPTARLSGSALSGDRYQLAFGHSRLAAYKRLHARYPDDPRFREFPLNLRPLTDRQMADAAASENIARKDLSAIEIAGAIQRYMADFGATQLEAGKIYGYTSQSSVSNLLRLLQLPEPVRALVNDGKLPERHARELITLGKAAPQVATTVARQYADAAGKAKDEDDISGAFDQMLNRAYDKEGVRFSDAVRWDRAWPGKPIAIESPNHPQSPDPRSEGLGTRTEDRGGVARAGQPDSVPACRRSAWQR